MTAAELVKELGPSYVASAISESDVRKRLDNLTKPPGSLGQIEDVAARLAKIVGDPPPPMDAAVVLVMAGDHGVTRSVDGRPSVSAFPREVTVQMCHNIAGGGAAISAFAKAVGAQVMVVDVGVDAEAPLQGGVLHRRVSRGTEALDAGPAMTIAEAEAAIRVGFDLVTSLGSIDVLCLGEMGIGNTTAASAVTAALTSTPAAEVLGPGTGVGEAVLSHKQTVIEKGLRRIATQRITDPLHVLAEIGGLEIAGLVGAVLGAARRGLPVVTDGFIATSAVLAAARIDPAVVSYVFASHESTEPGHRIQLEALDLEPLLHLGLRLGEGTGAALALPLIRSAGAILREMATFDGAGVATEIETDSPILDHA